MYEESRRRPYRILCIITGCGGGDWPPLLALAEGLYRGGHELLVVCDRGTEKAVQATGLSSLILPQSHDLANIFEPAISRLLSRNKKLVQEEENPMEIWGESCAEYIQKTLSGWIPSLVITSLLGVGLGKVLCERLSTSWCFLNPSFYFGYDSRHLWATDFSEMGEEMYRHWLLPLTKKANLVLHATDPEFDTSPVDLSARHKHVGPLFWEQPWNGPKILERAGSPWVLIAVSTSPQPDDLILVKSAINALESTDFRVLVTLAPGHNRDRLGRIPDNVWVTGYTPHSAVLNNCQLVISHAGHGIVMKSMVHGIPMVLVPWGRDQPGVAARAERLGIAVVVPRSECSARSLDKAIKKIQNGPKYMERIKVQSSRLQNTDGVAKSVDLVERFLLNQQYHAEE